MLEYSLKLQFSSEKTAHRFTVRTAAPAAKFTNALALDNASGIAVRHLRRKCQCFALTLPNIVAYLE